MENRLVRRQARRILDAPTAPHGNRLTLILAQICLLTITVGVYLVSLGLYAMGALLFGEALWLDIATYGLMGLVALFILLPLAASVYRMVSLMTLARYATPALSCLPVTDGQPELSQLFYPFTSLRAYGRTLAVGLETLGWVILSVGIPAVGFGILHRIFATMSVRGVHTTLCNLLTVASLLLCVAFGLLWLFLSGWRAGFGYFAFIHEDLPLREVNHYFRGFRRGLVKPFALRFSLAGWVALSVAAVLVPFPIHTVPYGLCCAAVYAAELERK